MAHVKSEYEVESMFLDRLQEMGYGLISMSSYDDVVRNFREKLIEVNSNSLIEAKGEATLSDDEFNRIMIRLEGKSIYDSARILREKWPLQLDNGKIVYIEFLTSDETRNRYQVTHQVTMDPDHKDDVVYKNRYDVTILINGLPLVQIELKRPGVDLNEAVNQINRYRRYSFHGLFRYIQVFVVSNSTLTKYFANSNESFPGGERQDVLKSLTFYWTDAENRRVTKLIDFTNTFFPKFQLTELLTKYFIIKDTEPVLMVMRPYQIYAVKLAFDRIIGSKKNGYVFHTTGSGKTLTSFRLATLLRDDRRIDRVFFLIDRRDLDDQTVDEYNSFEKDCVDNTDDTRTLIVAIKDPSKGLIITTMQKMANALRMEKYAEDVAPLRNQLCVFIIDECHRSQFGKMHAAIRKHFEDSNFIGFTGTPIFKENCTNGERTTADVFSTNTDKLSACIHRYMIKEAIADGNVLRFSVEYMRTINKLRTENDTYDLDKIDDPEYCAANGIDLEELYHHQDRIEMIADDIMQNLSKHTHPSGTDTYTAIFAVDRIPVLMRYYRYMKEHNPNGYKIAAIFTFNPNGENDEGSDKNSIDDLQECMDDYNDMFGTSFGIPSFDLYRKDIAKRMKQKELPQVDLLLVVNMFLTGFDSKPTNTLILDKNLVWHSLLQAYSRTNRVDKLTKQFGQIITYRNIKKAQDDALRLFSGDGDPEDYLLQSYEYYVAKYRELTETLRNVCPTAGEAAYLDNEDDQKVFIIAFRDLSHTLATIKTFSKFDWNDLDMFLDEEEYSDYKSWYLVYWDQRKRDDREGKQTEISDIDFGIELVRTDRINVVYILNLLKDINRDDMVEKQKSIDLILREIERSDNESLRHKKDMLRDFITERFFDLEPGTDIVAAYEEYEHEHMQKDISYFAEKSGVGESVISEVVSSYLCNPKTVTMESVREKLSDMHLGLLKTTKLTSELMNFSQNAYDKYTSEDN